MLAHLVLFEVSYWKRGTRQLVLRQRKQKVGLILALIRAATKPVRAVTGDLHASVMPGGERVGAKTDGALQQRRKLQVGVAVRARDGRAAKAVFAHKVRHHLFVEPSFEVDDVVGDADGGCDASRVVQVVDGAAGPKGRLAFGLVVQLHGHTDNLVTLLGEQRRGD